MKTRALLLSLLALLALGLAWWLLRPSPPAPAPVATVPPEPGPTRTGPARADGTHLPFIEPARERPTNVPGAPPPEPEDYSDDPLMQAAMKGELPVGVLGAPPSDLIAQRSDELRDCWRQHKGTGDEGYEVRLRFTIAGEEEDGEPKGRVDTIRVLDEEGNAVDNPGPFEVCAHTVVADLEFVAPEEGARIEINMPLELQAGE
jgi:hypothetical protein